MERITVIWLRRDVNTRDNDHSKYIRAQLRGVIDYLQTFNDIVDCEKYIRDINNETLFLVASSEYTQDIV
ncbi:unnamed protein product [Rotaria sp. Silwood2]|nr:unnamed protein product [Rotaria sp. Silwood2]CAF3075837.1 unnamed protein product [Rotaria sp. Silwood2]CAF3334436.1 unnamed protein product [Rotaria sp. Silwood2]CAF3413628.1 unnamed protein product [Rotaria sp. Silwood2]CAF3937309.1 unnamed protein product [Rotaria sp. Silwood2]